MKYLLKSDDTTTVPLPRTVGIAFVRGMLSGVSSKCTSFNDILKEVNVAPELIFDDAGYMTLQQYAHLMRCLVERFDDEMLGFLSRPAKRGSFALQVRSGIGAPTLEIAMRRVAQTFRLLNDDVILVHVRRGENLSGIALHFLNSEVAHNPFVHEYLLRVFWRVFAWLIGGRLPAVEFDFAFSRPKYCQAYSQIFPAPWTFDALKSAFWFDSRYLCAPTCRDGDSLRDFVENGPINLLLPQRDTGISGRIRQYLKQAVPHWPDLEMAARVLIMSPSSLQRHLANEGTSYQALKSTLRCEIAIARLISSQAPLIKIAEEIGFADAASFQKAFKTWTGFPPGAYRRRADLPRSWNRK